ncbi:hypothetical protein G9A89_018750 [Geosiphon pyriformis]|nr:hypothetical protein G9A89_018750 [Geosiphon pyriformis]
MAQRPEDETSPFEPQKSYQIPSPPIDPSANPGIKTVVVPPPYYVNQTGKMILRPNCSLRLWNFTSWCCITSCVLIAKFFLRFCAKSTVYNKEPFIKVLMDPQRTRPILTVANHLSTLDDPLLWASLPLATNRSLNTVRWTLGAQEICFTSSLLSHFFAFGQVVPTVRGAGIYQPAMNFALDRLNEGKWVHIFPEGKINPTPSMIPLRWGVGRLMMETSNLPIVVPLWHKGLQEIMPLERESSYIPILGQKVVIAFGEPIDLKDVLTKFHQGKIEERETRIKITDVIFSALNELQKTAEALEADRVKEKTL